MRAALLGLAAVAAVLLLFPGARATAGLEAPALLEDHAPIRIDSDGDWDAAHGVRGGNGTAESPFLLAHWRINSTQQALRIANTTRPFVVRNVELNGQCSGSNCTLEAGVVLDHVRGGSVVHVRITGMDRAGISVESSPGVELVENLVEGGGAVNQAAGVLVHRSDGVQLRGNRVLDVGPSEGAVATAAVRVWESNDTLVADNEVRGAAEVGLSLINARRVEVVDNRLSGNNIGLSVQGRDGIAHHNTITDNRLQGALLASGGWLRLERNDVAYNGRGVEVVGPANATLALNNLVGNTEFALRAANGASVDAVENWWGAANGPDVNGTGPGSGGRIVLDRTPLDRVRWQPFLAQRVDATGAHAPRPGGTVVVVGSDAPGGAGPAAGTPVAVLEAPERALVGEPVAFSAARSLDPRGAGLRYAWDFGDGAQSAGPRASHAYDSTGDFAVRLTVTDAAGAASRASVALNVSRAPLGVALVVPASVFRTEDLVVRAVASGQALGPMGFRFTSEGPGTFRGEPSPANSTRLRLTEPREYLVGVEATAGGERATAFERVQVLNRPPEARIEVEPERGDTRTEFRLSAALSKDADGDPLTFRWDLGGQPADGPSVTHRFTVGGRHLVVLTAGDGFALASAQLALDVTQAPEQQPAKTPGFPALAALAALALLARFRRGR